MRQIQVDLSCPIEIRIGYIGEHNATELCFILDSQLQTAQTFKIKFGFCNYAFVTDNLSAEDGILKYTIPQEVTNILSQNAPAGIQVVGYVGDTIIKSPIIKTFIGGSLPKTDIKIDEQDIDLFDEISLNSAARHSHSNQDSLDKISEAEDGTMLFNGEEIKGGGVAGEDGEDGVTFTPSVSNDGILSWTNDGGLDNPAPINISGIYVGEEPVPDGTKIHINPNGDMVGEFLPAVTTEDNGKIPMVVNGAWAVVAIPNYEEVGF